MPVLLAAVLAHLCADFLFQTDRTARRRAEGYAGAYLAHGLALFFSLLLALHFCGLPAALLFSMAGTAAHLVLDWLKERRCLKRTPMARFLAFLADQALHLLTLAALWRFIGPRPDGRIAGFYASFLPQGAAEALASASGGAAGHGPSRILLGAVVYAAVTFGGAVLIRLGLEALRILPPGAGRASGQGRVGKYIGILERGLVLTLVLAGALPAVGFVIAAKSVARFRELDDREFAEYYLVGTLASSLLAVGAGLWLKAVLTLLS